MMTPRGGLGAAIIDGTVYAVGGETPTGVLGTVEAFDLATGSAWVPVPSMRTPRHGVAVQSVGPSLYAIDGGRQPQAGAPSKVAEVLRP
ncbi:MAG: hypothetical protein E6G57_12475 [Actinobacteria bacterium]|nr:MAG: hypothetical protein E6G57_12475 [Actinomycetota bacterium]